MNKNCPICNKAGLPDYTKESVVCPQCNSDLKAFLLLSSVSKPQKSKISTIILIGMTLFAITFFSLYIKSNSDKKVLNSNNELLNDSIIKIKHMQNITFNKGELRTDIAKQEVIIKYIVKKGDCPYKIARFFYSSGSKYKLIEKDNNLEQPYTLKIGQILKIKISQ